MSSLVIVNMPKATDEMKRTVAGQCGVNFIRLVTKEPINTDYRELSYQTVHIRVADVGKKRTIKAVWSTHPDTGEPRATGALIYYPNEFHIGVAYLPDSPLNRKKLAASIYSKSDIFEIEDDKLNREIHLLAEQMKSDPELKAKEAKLAESRKENQRLLKEAEERRRGKDVNSIDDKLKQITDVLAQFTALQLQQLQAQVSKVAAEKPAEVPAEKKIDTPVLRGKPAGRIIKDEPAKPVEEEIFT